MKKLLALFMSAVMLFAFTACSENNTENPTDTSSSAGESLAPAKTALTANVWVFIPLENGYFLNANLDFKMDNTCTIKGFRYKAVTKDGATQSEIGKINNSLKKDEGYPIDYAPTPAFKWSYWGHGALGATPEPYKVMKFEDFFTKPQVLTYEDTVAVPSYILDGPENFEFKEKTYTYTYSSYDKAAFIKDSILTMVMFDAEISYGIENTFFRVTADFNTNNFKEFFKQLKSK